MKQPDALNDVAEFHRTFQHPIQPSPTIPDPDRCALRVSLLAEELDELREAIQGNDLVEVADALCDLQYVLSGAILEFGLADKFKELFEEVQRSNMSKVCKSREEAEATVVHYREHKSMEGEIVEKNGQYLVYRKSDRKVLKSIAYAKASIEPIVDKPI